MARTNLMAEWWRITCLQSLVHEKKERNALPVARRDTCRRRNAHFIHELIGGPAAYRRLRSCRRMRSLSQSMSYGSGGDSLCSGSCMRLRMVECTSRLVPSTRFSR